MGSAFSHLIPCLKPEQPPPAAEDETAADFTAEQPLDETLGHSFCYVRSSARFLSPTPSDRFLSPTQSLRFSPSHERSDPKPARPGFSETGFRAISGASVSANTSTPRTVLQVDGLYDDAADFPSTAAAATARGGCGSIVGGFESTSLFSALPLQPVPRGEQSGPIEGGGFFLSGPIERGALSGPLDASAAGEESGRVPHSAPLRADGGLYTKSGKRRKKSLAAIKKAFNRNLSEKKRPWVVPVRNFAGRKEVSDGGDGGGGAAASMMDNESENNVQWALGKAGEDRVHVVVSEENGWLFVGIYDGFNGPDAPEFLMSHLYRAVYNELKGLFWDNEDSSSCSTSNHQTVHGQGSVNIESCSIPSSVEELSSSDNREVCEGDNVHAGSNGQNQVPTVGLDAGSVKKVTFQSEKRESRRKLWEFLAEDDGGDGLDLSGSERFAFSVGDAVRVSNAESVVGRRSLLLSKLKQGLSRSKDAQNKGSSLPWRFSAEEKEKNENVNRLEERVPRGRKKKIGPVDHGSVLRALSRALEKTELAYLDLTDKVMNQYPELALMGSCLLVALMRDEDVYVMNLGDSRAIIAQIETTGNAVDADVKGNDNDGESIEGIMEEHVGDKSNAVESEGLVQATKLTALQLSTDHSTSIEEEILRIKREHPDDNHCIVNDRVKGRLKVTRAFGAGFLKQAKFNDTLLEMFRNEFIGNAPYVSCTPSLCHYRLGARDQFLILSSDGLYQYLTNQEVVSHVARFMESNQDGDPAQHLIEVLLSRAAKKAGMDFHDLLDIPQGDRRKYHDDVTVMVVSLEGRIWKSSGKYP